MVNKKAQGEIITIILIILLVLAAIIIVWQVIQGTVEKGRTEVESQTECLGLKIDITRVVTGLVGSVYIRPNKALTAYRVYVNGELIGTGLSVNAFVTDTLILGEINSGDEIEIIGEINNKICQIGSAKRIVSGSSVNNSGSGTN